MKKKDGILNTVFAALVFVMTVVPLVLIASGVKGENVTRKALAPMPSIIKNGSLDLSFTEELNDCLTDRIPLKAVSTKLINTVDSAVLNDCIGDEAIPGRDGFLFFGETSGDLLGFDQLTEDEARSVCRFLDHIGELCEGEGVKLVFVIAPDKASVYSEMLPGRLIVSDTPRSMDLVIETLSSNEAEYFIDLKPVIVNAKAERLCYYKRDSHWNEYGACCVYNAIAKQTGLRTYDENTYSVIKDHEGDLERFAASFGDHSDERIVYPVFAEYRSEKPIDLDNSKINVTESDVNDLTVLIWHDSFGKALQPFFSQSAGKVVMLKTFPYDMDSIEEYSPDILVIEIAERKLPKLYELAKAYGY